MTDLTRNEAALADAVRSSALEFLRVELKIANTMLDLAASASEQETHERRREQARIACDTVKRYLDEPAVPIPTKDHDAISESLRALEQRISTAP
jgi:hypothetical protein